MKRAEPNAASSGGILEGMRATWLVVGLVMVVLVQQLDKSMLTPALPAMSEELGVGLDQIAFVSTAFLLVGAVGGVAIGRWSDFIGRRRTLFIQLVVLAIGTALCWLAPNFELLLLGRVIQGVCGGSFQLSAMILSENLDRKRFAASLGILTAVNGGVGGFDGYVAGLLTQEWGFRSIFAVIFATALVAIIFVRFTVPKQPPPITTGRMDWTGAGLFAVFLVSLNLLVSNGAKLGWLSPAALLSALVCLAGAAAFWFAEKHVKTPLIAVHHLKSRQVWPALLTVLLSLASVFAVLNFTVVLLSQNSEVGYGLDAATSALLYLAPPALIGMAAAPFAGWLAGRLGWLMVLRGGLVLSLSAMLAMNIFLGDRIVVAITIAFLGFSYNGLLLTTTNALGVLQSPVEAPGALPGMIGAAFGIGAGLGISIIAPLAAQGTMAGFHSAIWVSIGIGVLALAIAFLIDPSKKMLGAEPIDAATSPRDLTG
ncbi:MFS transporter [Agromyces bracchium]|uniref:MFS transporter n=1 Tax=Agromyces bracchium TaxID=88376 RepID=A0A6I3M7S3_9MICO|nr:MFS transporter [Agromyces bracchium]MTH69384.1 MFS transporter [Agromyces bracchium]